MALAQNTYFVLTVVEALTQVLAPHSLVIADVVNYNDANVHSLETRGSAALLAVSREHTGWLRRRAYARGRTHGIRATVEPLGEHPAPCRRDSPLLSRSSLNMWFFERRVGDDLFEPHALVIERPNPPDLARTPVRQLFLPVVQTPRVKDAEPPMDIRRAHLAVYRRRALADGRESR